jgi:hypothetical protein
MPTSPAGHSAIGPPASESDNEGDRSEPLVATDTSDASAATTALQPTSAHGEPPEQPFDAVLELGTRTEASLNQLLRAIEQVSSGVSGARDANEQLARALVHLRQMLAESNQERLSLKGRVVQLEQELIKVQDDADRERVFLTDQQDSFLDGLLEEQEKALTDLRGERDDALAELASIEAQIRARATRPGTRGAESEGGAELGRELEDMRNALEKATDEQERAREVLRRLQAQRDTAQSAAEAAEKELHAARAELEKMRSRMKTIPPSPSEAALPAVVPDAASPRSTAAATRTSSATTPSQPPASAMPAIHLPRVHTAVTPPATPKAVTKAALHAPTQTTARAATAPVLTMPSEPPSPLEAAKTPYRRANQDAVRTNPMPRRSVDLDSEPTHQQPDPADEDRDEASDVAPEHDLDWAGVDPATPEELRAALTPVPSSRSADKPGIRRKPDPTERNLGGYSVGRNTITPEDLRGGSSSSKPPRR